MPKFNSTKELYHSLFNQINNICIAAGSNRKILQEENLDSLSSDELRKKISELTQVLIRIEDNARRLDEGLRKIYSQHIEK